MTATAPSVDRLVMLLLAAAGVLLLANLDNGYLWQDEAETALVARNTLAFGYPRGTDGWNAIDISPFGYGPGDAWIYNPWLPFYLLAGVFAVAGQHTWSARLPFALAGLACVFLTWRLVRLLTADRLTQRLSVALLACSVPFLLHMRQCRYYAPTMALLLGVCVGYLAFLHRPSLKRALGVGGLLALLFHANFGTFIPAFGVVLLHQWRWGNASSRRLLWPMAGLVAVLTVPWAVVLYQPAFVGTPSVERAADHLEYYVRVTNKHLIPLAAMAASWGVWWLARRRWSFRLPVLWSSPPRTFLAGLVAAQLAFLVVPDQRHLRYLMPVLPLLLIGEAAWLAGWVRRSRLLGGVLAGLALFTTALQSVDLRIPLADFAYELTHAYRGPMEGIVEYLREHARPGQTAKIPYDDRTLMFYTELRVERPSDFLRESYPDWLIVRRGWLPEEFFHSDYFRRIEAAYDRIELDAPDLLWQNREDPGQHQFRTVRDAPRVVLYRKRSHLTDS